METTICRGRCEKRCARFSDTEAYDGDMKEIG